MGDSLNDEDSDSGVEAFRRTLFDLQVSLEDIHHVATTANTRLRPFDAELAHTDVPGRR